MKNCLLLSAILGFAVVASRLHAQTPAASAKIEAPPKVVTPGKNALNETLPKWIRINGSIRGRLENGEISMPGNTTDLYYLSRLRLDVTFAPTSWLSVFAQMQDTRTWGYDHGQPAGSMRDPFDLRQGFIQLGGGEARGQWLRGGRQEVMYGTGRILSASDFSNTGKSFDILRGAFYRPGVKLEFLGGAIVAPDPSRFDRHKPGEHIYGTYDAFDKLIPGGVVEPYFFVRTQMGVLGERAGPAGDATLFIPGIRLVGKAPWRLDYSFELLHQSGSFATDQVEALGGTYTLGWTVTRSGWKPRASADFSHASGDDNAKDGVKRTFDQLYGGHQPFSSLNGLFGWRNIRNLRAGMDIAPFRSAKVMVDYRDINLATTQDGIYNGSGSRVMLCRTATSPHVGDAVEVQLVYLWPHGFTTASGLGTLFSGDYLRQAGQHSNYLYPYFSWSRRF